MTAQRLGMAILAMFLAGASLAQAQTLDLPAAKIPGGKPGAMMKQHWLRQAEGAQRKWQKEYEERTTPEQIAEYQKRLREKFLEALGGLPERTPLEPQVTGTVRREGYRVEKVLYQSRPKHFVSALLFVPEKNGLRPPYPGVLVPCGHSQNGKGSDAYQSMGALLALNGMVGLVVDPIEQGERGQYLGAGGWPEVWGVEAHWRVGIGSTLLGRNTASFEIWDNMRGIDYLQSRPEVDPQRIGCTGNSGGGTQTSYMMALDERIKAAAPSCYLCGFPALLATIGPQDAEQNIFNQLGFGLDHADYIMMRAPSPVLMCTATKDFFDIHGAWETFRSAKRLYTRLGFAERVEIMENDAGHNYNSLQRQSVARWMARWLAGRDQPICEPPLKLLSEQEYQCTPGGQVMLLNGARSVYDLNAEYERQLAARRAAAWQSGRRGELLARVRRAAGIRPAAELPRLQVEEAATIPRTGYRIEQLLLRPEEGIGLPALLFRPDKPRPGPAVVYLHERGKAADASPGGPIEALAAQGRLVLAVDLCGTGQTQPDQPEWQDAFLAYLLGRSYVGVRAEEVLAVARYAQELVKDTAGVDLVAVGHVGIPALHAAAVEPGVCHSLKLVRTLRSWSAIVGNPLARVQQAQVVFGALQSYDLPDLAASLGPKLTVQEPASGLEPPPKPGATARSR
ncbi:MAG: acetylxylan esterase [Thermoguttaceae bacterium]